MKTSPAKRQASSPSSNLGALIVGFFLIILLAIFVSPWMAQALIQSRLSKATALSVNIGGAHFNLTRPRFWIKDLQFFNPKGFPAAPLAQIGEVKAQYAPVSIFLGRPHFKKVKIDFKEFRLMRNGKGILNLPPVPAGTPSRTTIDELELNLNTVTYTDLSSGQPVQQTYSLGLANSVYRNVNGVPGILEILSWEVLKRTGVPEKITPAPNAKSIAELRAADQTASVPAPKVPSAASQSKSAPSLAPSAQAVAAPSSKAE